MDWHPHLHAREEAVYAPYLRFGKIKPQVVEQIRGWRHSGIEPPQEEVIQKILKHCGLWQEPARGPPAESATADRDAVAQALAETELTYVPIDEFLAEW